MAKCEFHDRCGLQADVDREDGLCTLHSPDPSKSRSAFDALLSRHLETREGDYAGFVFPEGTKFQKRVFSTLMDFSGATFLGHVEFGDSVFAELANFDYATFEDGCGFAWVHFKKGAWFANATFKSRSTEPPAASFLASASFRASTFDGEILFLCAHFLKETTFGAATFKTAPSFDSAIFEKETSFSSAKFEQGADFDETTFADTAIFSSSSFLGRTIFASVPWKPPMFSGIEVDFRNVEIKPLDAVTFREADLRKCRFYNTDLRQVEMTGVLWLKKRNRLMVYDEVAPAKGFDATSRFGTERLYRQLKQNYDERRDYERVGDFHYGEKEMRRKNHKTPLANRCFLTLYWLVSGYGERYLRPLLASATILIVSICLYLELGIYPKGEITPLRWDHGSDWVRVMHYGLRIMTLLKSEDLVPSEAAGWVNTIQSIIGPILIGLFALALRQRLKR